MNESSSMDTTLQGNIHIILFTYPYEHNILEVLPCNARSVNGHDLVTLKVTYRWVTE